MMREQDLYLAVISLAYDWDDAGTSWVGEDPWFEYFEQDVQLVVEGLEGLIGGADDPFGG